MGAARKALQAREAVGCADLSGWNYVHMAALHARLEEGDAALRCLQFLARSCMIPNGLTVHNDWRYQGLSLCWESIGKLFQIEAILGAPAAIAEMLLQSHHFRLRILPALSRAWPAGAVRGLRARGGFEVDIAWRNGRATAVRIRSRANVPCRLAVASSRGRFRLTCRGRPVPFERQRRGTIAFATMAGREYVIRL